MAVALQWHVATNADQPVALATSRSAETGLGEKDVLLVVCDVRLSQADAARTAAELARLILDAYHAQEAHSAHAPGTRSADAVNGAEHGDVAQWLADAITGGLRSLNELLSATPVAWLTSEASSEEPAHQAVYDVVATVIHQNTLYVARYGGGQVYLLRNGTLQHLTDASFVDDSSSSVLQPDMGQLDLVGEDRILVCSESFSGKVYDTQLRNILRSTPSSRRAAQTLLEVATRDEIALDGPRTITSLAVADYVTGRAGVFQNVLVGRESADPMAGPRRGTFRSIAAIAALLFLIAAAIFTVFSINNRGLGLGRISNAPTAAAFGVQPITATATTRPTLAPTMTPAPAQPKAPADNNQDVTPITSTDTATPAPTETVPPTPTLAPTQVIPTLVPTQTPTRKPKPRPTNTPLPPTATPVPPTQVPVPTNTPVPPPPSNNGGQPAPPCPPGATCK